MIMIRRYFYLLRRDIHDYVLFEVLSNIHKFLFLSTSCHVYHKHPKLLINVLINLYSSNTDLSMCSLTNFTNKDLSPRDRSSCPHLPSLSDIYEDTEISIVA